MFDAFTRSMVEFHPDDIGEEHFYPLDKDVLASAFGAVTDPTKLNAERAALVIKVQEKFGKNFFGGMDLSTLPHHPAQFYAIVSKMVGSEGAPKHLGHKEKSENDQLAAQEAMLKENLSGEFTGATGVAEQPKPEYPPNTATAFQQQAGSGKPKSEQEAARISARQLRAQEKLLKELQASRTLGL